MMEQPILTTADVQGLNDLKSLAHVDQQKALPQVAKQFESIFMQAMMKAMRSTQTVLSEDDPFHSENADTFQEMLDGQFVSSMTSGKGVGMADVLMRQLSQTTPVSPTTAKKDASQAMPVKVHTPVWAKSEQKVGETSGLLAEVPKTVKDFVQNIMPYAKQAASLLGLDPKLLVAQAALETGWGKFLARDTDGSSSNNYFNIKASNRSEQPSVQIKTTEFLAGTPLKISAAFKKYTSIGDSFHDYVNMILQNGRYQEAKNNAADPERFVNALHKAGYATDPLYVNKILTIYHSEDLNNALKASPIAIRDADRTLAGDK